MMNTTNSRIRLTQKLARFWRDRRGNYAVITALMSPVLIGSAGLATEGGLWMYVHQNLQGAADSAAISTATQYGLNVNASLDNQAQSVIATYGYTVGTAGTTVTVNRPPATGAYIPYRQPAVRP
jgi:Flp pilus assembly protein TadG